MVENKEKKPRFKIPDSAKAMLKRPEEEEEEAPDEDEEAHREEYIQAYFDLVEKEGIGFGDKDEAYVNRYMLYTNEGLAYYEYSFHLYESEGEVNITKKHEMKLINYFRYNFPDVYGVSRPEVTKIYKH